jgi:nucleotide-binding universal stress UspA family protein
MLNFNVIVVTTDLSDYSLRALPYAINLAERFKAALKIVHVHEPAIPISDIAWYAATAAADDEELQRQALAAVEKIIQEQVPDGVHAEAKVLTGNAADKIAEYARETNADLLVLCTHGRTGLSHVLMGSTAEAIVRQAPCPVLTLKQPMPVSATQKGN